MVAVAYESVRMATRTTTSVATAAQVVAYRNSLLNQLGVKGATVTVTPNNLANVAPQTIVTVSVSAPFGQNSLT